MNIKITEKEITTKVKFVKIGNYDIEYSKVLEFLEIANGYEYFFYFDKASDKEIERALFENGIIKLSKTETKHNNEIISNERKIKLADLLGDSDSKKQAKRIIDFIGVKRYDIGDKYSEFKNELNNKLNLFNKYKK